MRLPEIEFNISDYVTRLAGVKQDYENSDIIEAQKSISKIVNELETKKEDYLAKKEFSLLLVEAYLYKGICFSGGGFDEKEIAMSALKEALKINPKHEKSKTYLMGIELSLGIPPKRYTIVNKFA